MKVVILNGSPKGEYSITLQYIRFLQKCFPLSTYKMFHVAQKIKAIEKNEEQFQMIVDEVHEADIVLWSFGVWVLAVAAQYLRFIELIFDRKKEGAFSGKYTAAISTSINYFDHMAHNYIRATCEDLGMSFLDSLSFDIVDLKSEAKREILETSAKLLFERVESRGMTSRQYYPMTVQTFDYQPEQPTGSISTNGQKVLILTDQYDRSSNQGKMINRFRQLFADSIDLVNLSDIDIRGACLGCMRCGYDYQCVYKDGFADFYNNRVRTADIIIIAGSLKGRFLSSQWKTFFDRAFFWNHTPSLEKKQIAYLISGPLSQNENLNQFLEASVTARQNANLIDIISDECEDSAKIDAQLNDLAQRAVKMAALKHIKPMNFLAVGGNKVFRDNIWGRLRGLWQADHRYYKKNGFYDFPQYQLKFRIMIPMLMMLTKIPAFRKKFYRNVKKMPSIRLGKVVDKIDRTEKREETI